MSLEEPTNGLQEVFLFLEVYKMKTIYLLIIDLF